MHFSVIVIPNRKGVNNRRPFDTGRPSYRSTSLRSFSISKEEIQLVTSKSEAKQERKLDIRTEAKFNGTFIAYVCVRFGRVLRLCNGVAPRVTSGPHSRSRQASTCLAGVRCDVTPEGPPGGHVSRWDRWRGGSSQYTDSDRAGAVRWSSALEQCSGTVPWNSALEQCFGTVLWNSAGALLE